MANIGFFDATTVEPSGVFEVLPAGEYPVMIVDSTMETTKSGNGQFLKLQLQVIDGPHQGATLFDRLNLINPNPKAVDIAQRALSAICHAIGVLQVQDSAQLHNRPLIARVAYREPQGEYGASNDIKGYKPIQGAAQQQPAHQQFAPPQQAAQQQSAQQTAMQQPPAQQQPAQASSTPPWMAGKAA